MGRLGKFRIWLFTVLLALMATCCARHTPPKVGTRAQAPTVTLQMSADEDFSGPERAALLEATKALENQTNGHLRLRIAFDLNFRDITSLREAQEHWSIIRLDDSAEVIQHFDAQCQCNILGLTVHSQRQVLIVANRLQTPEKWRHVVMHEALHAAGVPHVPDPRSLMFVSTMSSKPTECMHADDVKAFCDVAHCDVRDLPVCS